MHQLLFISPSNEEYIVDYIANIRHKLYLLYVKPKVDDNIQAEQLSVDAINDTTYNFNCIFMLTSLSQFLSRASKRIKFSKNKTTGADGIKKDVVQRGTFS